MRSLIYLEKLASIRPNIRVVVRGEDYFFVGDVVEVLDDNEVIVDVDGEHLRFDANTCFIPFVVHNDIKYYLSLAWRLNLTVEDIGTEVNFGLGTSTTNTDKAVRIKGYYTCNNRFYCIPWSRRAHSQDYELLLTKHNGELIENLIFFN